MTDTRHPDPRVRRSVRVLYMVHELHKQGFQKLRIKPYLYATGAWRCHITPARNVYNDRGADAVNDTYGPTYTSASEDQYFDWKDASKDTARQLAEKFRERFRDILDESNGQDWNYVGWFVEMLGHAEQGFLPYIHGEWEPYPEDGFLYTTLSSQPNPRRLPIPPGGDGPRYT